MTVTTVNSILILFTITNHHTKYCSKKFLKYSILCGSIYKAIFENFFLNQTKFKLSIVFFVSY